MNQTEFEIHYRFKGETRCFVHQAHQLCQSDALHCATLHAGVGTVSDHVVAGPVRLATLQAQGFGVTEVHWKRRRAAGQDMTRP
ncbi:hypothetical protein G7013_02425 [Pseudomonas viridiflava]|uniref:DUF6555 family protein n=1 Tax=Pseudomonas syringae group TaxID=136849 RepID=UPI000EFD30CB|nr:MULTISPECIES: DUF6555 family protein [Pseudomonas syringae group]MBA1228504.1 hypothetical protein [Pseudomonas viridiflava]